MKNRTSLPIQKNSLNTIFEDLWLKPLFSMQKDFAKSLKNSLFGTPLEMIVSAQESALEKLSENVNNNLDEAYNNKQMLMPKLMGSLTEPNVDIIENKNVYKLKAELPGVKEKDINIQYFDGGIQIEGEKYEESAEKGENYRHKECQLGYFSRLITLPEDADIEKAKTRFNLSILTIEVPKKQKSFNPNAKNIKLTGDNGIDREQKTHDPAKKAEVSILHATPVKKEEKKFTK